MKSHVDILLFIILKVCASEPLGKVEVEQLEKFKLNIDLWNEVLILLKNNRIENAVYYYFKQSKLNSYIPQSIFKQLFDAYATTHVKNRQYTNLLRTIIAELNSNNIIPGVWKGIILANQYYPDLGVRSMKDLDLYVPYEQKDLAIKVLDGLGFKQSEKLLSVFDVSNLENSNGARLDVHFKNNVFPQIADSELYVEDCSIFPDLKYRIYKPNVFFSFLIDHSRKHYAMDGLRYRYFLDYIFLIRKHSEELNHEVLEKYLTNPEQKHYFYKSIGFLKLISPSLNLPWSVDVNKKFFSIQEIRVLNNAAVWSLTYRFNPWLRLLLTWFKILRKKYPICPSLYEMFLYVIFRLKYRLRMQ